MKIRSRALLICLSFMVSVSPGAYAQVAGQTVPALAGGSESSVAAAVPSPRVFADFVQASVQDFRRLPSRETATWLAFGAAAALLGHSMDRPVTAAVSTAAFDKPFDAGDMIGKTRVQLGGAFATYALGRITGQPRVAAVGADLLRAQLITKTVTTALKVSIGRDRPDGTEWSFPSGHTSASFATATVLQQHFGWKAGVPAYGLATYVAASRIQERRHFLSDVVFGAAIGIVAGRTVTVGHGKGQFALAPVAAPGGAGVAFTWVGN